MNQTHQILTEKQDNYDAAQYVLATAVNYTKHSGTKILFTRYRLNVLYSIIVLYLQLMRSNELLLKMWNLGYEQLRVQITHCWLHTTVQHRILVMTGNVRGDTKLDSVLIQGLLSPTTQHSAHETCSLPVGVDAFRPTFYGNGSSPAKMLILFER